MRQKGIYYVFIILLTILGTLMIVSCGTASTPEPTPTPAVHPGKAIVASRCVGCHALSKVEGVRFNERGWQLVVDNMILYGAQLSEEQAMLAADYLSQSFPKE